MSKHNSEDTQPNEIRLARKGNSVIPAIQPTYPRGRQNLFYPRPNQRPTDYYANSQSFVPSFVPLPLFNPSRTYPSNRTSAHKPPGHSDHSTSYKRRRVEESSVRHSQPNPAQLTRDALPIPPVQHPSRIEITVDLPIHCRHGVADNKRARRVWLNHEIPKVEKERGVEIYGHTVGDSTLCFFARAVGPKSTQNTGDCCIFFATCGQIEYLWQ
jgi:hypothetical protein